MLLDRRHLIIVYVLTTGVAPYLLSEFYTLHKFPWVGPALDVLLALAIASFLAQLFYNHRFLEIKPVGNVLWSTASSFLSMVLSYHLMRVIIDYMLYLDEEKTPLGWSWKYWWYMLLAHAILLSTFTLLISLLRSKVKFLQEDMEQ